MAAHTILLRDTREKRVCPSCGYKSSLLAKEKDFTILGYMALCFNCGHEADDPGAGMLPIGSTPRYEYGDE